MKDRSLVRQNFFFDALPDEVVLLIFKEAVNDRNGLKTLYNLSQVNQRFHRVAQTPQLWVGPAWRKLHSRRPQISWDFWKQTCQEAREQLEKESHVTFPHIIRNTLLHAHVLPRFREKMEKDMKQKMKQKDDIAVNRTGFAMLFLFCSTMVSMLSFEAYDTFSPESLFFKSHAKMIDIFLWAHVLGAFVLFSIMTFLTEAGDFSGEYLYDALEDPHVRGMPIFPDRST